MTDLDSATAAVVRRLARRVHQLEQGQRDLGRASQARDRSLEGGAQVIYDDDDEPRIVSGEQPDGSYAVVDYGGAALLAPSVPLVAAFPGGATITWDGFNADDELGWPASFGRVNVHLSTLPGGAATQDTLIASIESAKGGAVSVAQPADVVTYCTLVAVTRAGVESGQSVEREVEAGPPTGGASSVNPPPAGTGTYPDGFVWRQIVDGDIVGMWEVDGGAWVPVSIGQALIVAPAFSMLLAEDVVIPDDGAEHVLSQWEGEAGTSTNGGAAGGAPMGGGGWYGSSSKTYGWSTS